MERGGGHGWPVFTRLFVLEANFIDLYSEKTQRGQITQVVTLTAEHAYRRVDNGRYTATWFGLLPAVTNCARKRRAF